MFFTPVERLREDVQDVLVYLTGTVGDVTLTLPVLVALKRKYPGASLSVLFAGNVSLREQLFRHLPYVDRMEDLSEDSLRSLRCDLFVNLSGSGQIGWVRYLVREMRYARRLGASAAIGFEVSTLGIYKWNSAIQHKYLRNETKRHLALARRFHEAPVYAHEVFPPNSPVRHDVLRALELSSDDAIAVMVPGASKAIKRWPPECFAVIARRLCQEWKLKVVVVGTQEEAGLVAKIVSLSNGSAVDAVGKLDLWGVVELLRLAKLCVTNDTGPLHIATVLRVPTVAIFSSSVPPTWWFPSGDKVRVLFSLRSCRHCFALRCSHVGCLSDIRVDDVWRTIVELYETEALTFKRE